MVLVVDGQGTVRNLRPQELAAAGVTVEEAFGAAADNLGKAFQAGQFEFGVATLVDDIRVGMARGNWMAPAGGLMLGNFHQMLMDTVGGTEFVAVAVNQESLLAFPTDERTLASRSLRIAIDDLVTRHPKPISRAWLKLDGTWPARHPLDGLFDERQPG